MFIRTLLTTDSRVVKIPFGMAKGHTYFWRKPGRRDEERKQFSDLMRKVEAVRIRYGMSKAELAAELGANADGVRAWTTGTDDRSKGEHR
jgi:ribosome-binding protein aMBF1 (putative translation factor)